MVAAVKVAAGAYTHSLHSPELAMAGLVDVSTRHPPFCGTGSLSIGSGACYTHDLGIGWERKMRCNES